MLPESDLEKGVFRTEKEDNVASRTIDEFSTTDLSFGIYSCPIACLITGEGFDGYL